MNNNESINGFDVEMKDSSQFTIISKGMGLHICTHVPHLHGPVPMSGIMVFDNVNGRPLMIECHIDRTPPMQIPSYIAGSYPIDLGEASLSVTVLVEEILVRALNRVHGEGAFSTLSHHEQTPCRYHFRDVLRHIFDAFDKRTEFSMMGPAAIDADKAAEYGLGYSNVYHLPTGQAYWHRPDCDCLFFAAADDENERYFYNPNVMWRKFDAPEVVDDIAGCVSRALGKSVVPIEAPVQERPQVPSPLFSSRPQSGGNDV